MQIQKMYLIHDFLYASLSLIPVNSLDGKDTIKTVYILTEAPETELDAYETYIYSTYEEAENELKAMS